LGGIDLKKLAFITGEGVTLFIWEIMRKYKRKVLLRAEKGQQVTHRLREIGLAPRVEKKKPHHQRSLRVRGFEQGEAF